MKRILGTIAMCLLVGTLSAQSVWTGNAAVGTSGDFPGESAVLRAASNSFPSGTELRVTNPRGGQSVEVTITGRLETPGVFILIERAAATAIDLPTDHVLPVRVTPLKAERALSPTAAVRESDPLSDDSDYNPAVTLNDDIGEVRTALAPVPAPETLESVEEPPILVVPETVTPPEELEEPEEPEAIEEPVDTETIFVYDISTDDEPEEPETLESEPIVDLEEPSEPPIETPDEPSEDDRVVYFLTPSDLKPPPAAEGTVPPAALKDDKVVKESVPDQPTPPAAARVETSVPVDLSTSLTMMPPDDTRPYIQIGAYRNQAVLENTAGRLMRDAPEYPLSYTVDTNAATPVYKLLIGPLRPAEKGVVLENARSTVFPDAFLLPK
ncbi:MAG: hypothetical protein RQ801_08275 [Spirochaetaceae bacterium]|nr:hypothetical protein [Spirochaetaceae bacterium]MDT8298279.1 hypothetical protein [Spirochaetaceae bacterium]